jgi:tRNA synthetases class I (C) catalytic domain
MSIKLYNTRTQSLETFTPITPGQVQMYVYGITTYDHAHAGHARTYSTFDLLNRHLRSRGYKVTMVRNVTDVEDKIMKRSAELGEAPLDLAKRISDLCDAELETLGCLPPELASRVSTRSTRLCPLESSTSWRAFVGEPLGSWQKAETAAPKPLRNRCNGPQASAQECAKLRQSRQAKALQASHCLDTFLKRHHVPVLPQHNAITENAACIENGLRSQNVIASKIRDPKSVGRSRQLSAQERSRRRYAQATQDDVP